MSRAENALKYGATGAATGAMFGPLGAAIGGGIGALGGALLGGGGGSDARTPDPRLAEEAAKAGLFADYGQQQYQQSGQQLSSLGEMLLARAQGGDSLAMEQLRQGLAQNQAAQRSMAASANPRNAAMAARLAATNSARLGAGLSGQAAQAGIMERQAAQQALGQMLLGQRGQDLQAALGSRGNALQGYGASENSAVARMNQPTTLDKVLGAAQGGLSLYATMQDKKKRQEAK